MSQNVANALEALRAVNTAVLRDATLQSVAYAIAYACTVLEEEQRLTVKTSETHHAPERSTQVLEDQLHALRSALASFEGLNPETADYCTQCSFPYSRPLQILTEGVFVLHCPHCFSALQ